jgi:hypothetical protein
LAKLDIDKEELKKEGEDDSFDEEDSYTMTEVQNIFTAQKDDPFFDVVDNKNQAQLHYIQLKTKYPIESFINGMTAFQAPEMPKSITGSNPFKENESEINNKLERKGSQLQEVRLNDDDWNSNDNGDNEEMDSKHGLKFSDLVGKCISYILII